MRIAEFWHQLVDPGHPDDRNKRQTEEWQRFKREVYHKVLKVIFSSLVRASYDGDVFYCGNGEKIIGYPGFLIESLDGEEAACFCAVFAANANYPCPKCLARKTELDRIDKSFPLRTPENMQQVLSRARAAATSGEKARILQEHGLHDVEVRKIMYLYMYYCL